MAELAETSTRNESGGGKKTKPNGKNALRNKEGSVSAQIIVHLFLIQREKNATADRAVMSALLSDSLLVPKPSAAEARPRPHLQKEGGQERRKGV